MSATAPVRDRSRGVASALRRPGAASAAPAVDRPERPRLRLVEALRPRRAFGRRSVLVALGVLVAALLLQLLLSMQLIQGAYAEDALESQRLQAQREVTAAQEEVSAVASPQHLATLATELGMVPAGGVATLDLATGAVVGPVGAPPLAAVDPSLVPNSITSGDRDRAEGERRGPDNGASAPAKAEPAVPSEFEIPAPRTR